MREERGKLSGDVEINELYTLWGMIVGNVNVGEEGKLYLRGSIYGDLTVEYGGRVHIYGNVQGTLTTKRGAEGDPRRRRWERYRQRRWPDLHRACSQDDGED